MSITLKQGMMAYRDDEGEYHGINVVGETTTANQIAAIQSAGTDAISSIQSASTSAISSIQTTGQATIASIPNEYTELNENVSDLKSALVAFEEGTKEIQLSVNTIQDKYVNYNTGSIGTASDNFGHIDYIPVGDYKKIKYSRIKTTTSTTVSGLAFYTEPNGSAGFISGSGVAARNNQDVNGYELYEVTVPTGAKYVAFSAWKDTVTYGLPVLYGIVDNQVLDDISGLKTRMSNTENALGDYFSLTVGNAIRITEGDLNNYTTPNNYYIYSPSNILNMPINLSGRLIVFGTYTSTTPGIAQIYIDSQGNIYKRHKATSWTSWAKLATEELLNDYFSLTVGNATRITEGDLNNYTTPTNYYIYSPSGILNMPTDKSGRLIVIGTYSSTTPGIAQIYIDSQGDVYKRRKTTTWTSWAKLATEELLSDYFSLTVGNATRITEGNLNNYTTAANYYIYQPSGILNMPTDMSGRLIVFGTYTSTTPGIAQIYIDSQGNIYKRHKATSWTAWTKLVTEADIAKITNISYGRQNAIASVNQMANIKWTPIRPIPITNSAGYVKANVECTGLPYSSTRSVCKYIGQHVSFYTFMSALQNPESVLYKRRIIVGDLGKTYYGVTCFTVTSYASGSKLGTFDNEKMRAKIGESVEISPYEILPGDALMIPTSYRTNPGAFRHEVIIYDIQKDNAGRITNVKLAEGINPFVTIRGWRTFNSFLNYVSSNNFIIYRKTARVDYGTYESLPFVKGYDDEVLESVVYPDIMPEYGDKACVEAGTDVTINIINSASYSQVLVYKDDTLIDTKPVADFTMNDMAYGTYRFVLTDGTNTSESSLIVADVNGTYDPNTKRVTFSSANAIPSFVASYAISGSRIGVQDYVYNFTKEDLTNGYADVTELVFPVWEAVQIGFKTEYGVAMWWSDKTVPQNSWENWTPPAEALS